MKELLLRYLDDEGEVLAWSNLYFFIDKGFDIVTILILFRNFNLSKRLGAEN